MPELELLTAPALRQLLANGTYTVVVPFGSVEDQNGHLPLGADSLLADLVGREVAARLDAVLAPTMRAGAGPPGTLGVRDGTLTDTAVALAERSTPRPHSAHTRERAAIGVGGGSPQ